MCNICILKPKYYRGNKIFKIKRKIHALVNWKTQCCWHLNFFQVDLHSQYESNENPSRPLVEPNELMQKCIRKIEGNTTAKAIFRKSKIGGLILTRHLQELSGNHILREWCYSETNDTMINGKLRKQVKIISWWQGNLLYKWYCSSFLSICNKIYLHT